LIFDRVEAGPPERLEHCIPVVGVFQKDHHAEFPFHCDHPFMV
jgi:hypothetical protein